MAALFTRVAIETYSAEARPHASLSAPFAKPYGRLDRAVAELAQVVGREAAPLPITEAVY
ncbi:adenine-specific DNA-methyltransferase, partial [Sphingomonas rubra]